MTPAATDRSTPYTDWWILQLAPMRAEKKFDGFVEEGRAGCCGACEVGVERLVGAVASGAGELCGGGESAVVGRVVEVGDVEVVGGVIERPSKRMDEEVGRVGVVRAPAGDGDVERLVARTDAAASA